MENIRVMSFKELEKAFNAAVVDLDIGSSTSTSHLKGLIFKKLVAQFPQLTLNMLDYNNNSFCLEFPYQQDFRGINGYDEGTIYVTFSIRTKRTDDLEEVSNTRKKYVHIAHEIPVKFYGCSATTGQVSFEWANIEDVDDLSIKVKDFRAMMTIAKLKVTTVEMALSHLSQAVYAENFGVSIVQPFVKENFVNGAGKKKSMYEAFPEELQVLFKEKGDAFPSLQKFIQDNSLLKV